MSFDDRDIAKAAELIAQADGLIVAAGAGMGVDSGLPDFRGNEGFWNAYPALGKRGLSFQEIASPHSFVATPRLAWGFYGHRLAMYRSVKPHEGFQALKRWGDATLQGTAVFTSNVDGHFQAAGFPDQWIEECHGSIHHLQCSKPCRPDIWPADGFLPRVDVEPCELVNEPPHCPHCGALARPNVLMFNDWEWVAGRQAEQHRRLQNWLAHLERPVVVEIGAGSIIPSVREFSHRAIKEHHGRLIRINATDAQVPSSLDVGLHGRGLPALMAIDEHWRQLS